MHPAVHKQLYTLEHINRIINKLNTAHSPPHHHFCNIQHNKSNTIKEVVQWFCYSCDCKYQLLTPLFSNIFVFLELKSVKVLKNTCLNVNLRNVDFWKQKNNWIILRKLLKSHIFHIYIIKLFVHIFLQKWTFSKLENSFLNFFFFASLYEQSL